MGSLGFALAAVLAAASGQATAPRPVVASAPPAALPDPANHAASAPLQQNNACCASVFDQVGPNGERPLSITIESGIDIGRLGLTGHKDGDAAIDPQTGAKQVGPNMVDLGGLSFQGKATITGQPLRPVRIELPPSITLYTAGGVEAQLGDFRTDLPPVAMLDANGQLQFNFGATITCKNGQDGNFRGRIPIRVEYY